MAYKSPPNPEMGARAKARREYLLIPKNEFAVMMNISSQRLSQIETDGVSTIELACKWAAALDMPAPELIFGKKKGK
jgi:transcriptional regulator with XRE-family HTH domain